MSVIRKCINPVPDCCVRGRALNPLSFAEKASVRANSKGSPLAFSTVRSVGLIILLSSSVASAGVSTFSMSIPTGRAATTASARGVAVADAARPGDRPQRLPLVTCSGNAFHANSFQGAGRRDTPGKMFHLPFPAAIFELLMVGEPQDIVRRKGGRVEINLMQPMAGKKKSRVCRLHRVILRQDAGEG
ncbi:Uncharacterised protein [Raoultella planticola]|uniref:Uncharacterized protein n=1 Tax=Raoultella planticola TaxID=575 RepID=A0A485AN39_RAOPL|nr:Uncharacterised protein [Raoultella planticola]